MSKYVLTDNGIIEVNEVGLIPFEVDECFEEAARLCIAEGAGSASLLQRRLEIGYARAARLLDQLEEVGILSPSEGNKPRQVVVSSFEEFAKDQRSPRTVDYIEKRPEAIKAEWNPNKLTKPPMAEFQKEFQNQRETRLPVGMNSKKKIVSIPLNEAGQVYVFNSPLCKSSEMIRGMLDGLVNTYSPDDLKLIVSDDLRLLVAVNGAPHLLTPVITDQSRLKNALSWTEGEQDRRIRLFEEMGVDGFVKYNDLTGFLKLPRILCVICSKSGGIANDEDSLVSIERLLNSGLTAGIHMIVSAPLMEKRFAKLMLGFTTKIVFKTFSTVQADMLGTDDAFELESPEEFLFIPAYGKVEKLSI